MRRERIEQKRQSDYEIIQRRGRVRRRPLWKILKRMMPNDQPRPFRAQPHARHSRVAIRIHEVNVPGDKNILVIRAPCRQDQSAEKGDFDDAEDSPNHFTIPNPGSAIRN